MGTRRMDGGPLTEDQHEADLEGLTNRHCGECGRDWFKNNAGGPTGVDELCSRCADDARSVYVIDQATDCTECCYSRELCTCREFSAPKEPYDGDDGEVFRGGESDSYEREQMSAWQRLK